MTMKTTQLPSMVMTISTWSVGYMTETGEDHNLWVAKFDSELNLLEQLTVNGSANSTDDGYGILFDGAGHLYVAGTLSEIHQGYNIWLARYDRNLDLRAYTTVNGSADGYDTGLGVVLGRGRDLYISATITEVSGGANIWLAHYRTRAVLGRIRRIFGRY